MTSGEARGEHVGGLNILTPQGLLGSSALLLPGVLGALMVTFSWTRDLAEDDDEPAPGSIFSLFLRGELERTDMGDSSVLGVKVRRNSLGELRMDL